MEIQLLYFEGCPNWKTAEAHLLALAADFPIEVKRIDVGTGHSASHPKFRGSPTILVDGSDPFPSAASTTALSCRIYSTPSGAAGSPTIDQVRAAVGQATKHRT